MRGTCGGSIPNPALVLSWLVCWLVCWFGLVDMGGVWGGLPWVVLVRALVCSTDMGGVREGEGRVDVSNDVSNAFVCVVGSGGGGG